MDGGEELADSPSLMGSYIDVGVRGWEHTTGIGPMELLQVGQTPAGGG